MTSEKTGRERVKSLVSELESWCWAHTETYPQLMVREIACDLDTLAAAKRAAEELTRTSEILRIEYGPNRHSDALDRLLTILTKGTP